jgi:hypothetical protein
MTPTARRPSRRAPQAPKGQGSSALPTAPCSIPGCERPVEARGYCAGHYWRCRRRGDPHPDIPLRSYGRPACSAAGCNRKHFAGGYCQSHWRRLRAGADVDRPLMRMRRPFWEYVDRSGDCWLWTGYRVPTGYGQAWHAGRLVRAHRLAWELTYGPIPPGLCVCHACDVPACCNPAHLFIGPQSANLRDMARKGRRRAA